MDSSDTTGGLRPVGELRPAEDACRISSGMTVQGTVSGSQDVVVSGTFEGTVDLRGGCLFVERTGVVSATVSVRSCVVSGRMTGDISASERVVIERGARLVGDVRAPEVVVAPGANMRGRIDMGQAQASSEAADLRTGRPPVLRPLPGGRRKITRVNRA